MDCDKGVFYIILLNQNNLEVIRKNYLQSVLFFIIVFLFLITRILFKKTFILCIYFIGMMLSVLFNCDYKLFFGTLRRILWGGGDNITIARRGWKRRRSYYMQIM
jgi:hypothetical protein